MTSELDAIRVDWSELQVRIQRDMAEYARTHRAEIDAEWDAIPEVPRTFEQHRIYAAKVRRDTFTTDERN